MHDVDWVVCYAIAHITHCVQMYIVGASSLDASSFKLTYNIHIYNQSTVRWCVHIISADAARSAKTWRSRGAIRLARCLICEVCIYINIHSPKCVTWWAQVNATRLPCLDSRVAARERCEIYRRRTCRLPAHTEVSRSPQTKHSCIRRECILYCIYIFKCMYYPFVCADGGCAHWMPAHIL